jgi:molybdopterin/thiamine biosynthesis adenylyltransferase
MNRYIVGNCEGYSNTLLVRCLLIPYSYVLGHDAMKRMGSSNVLIAGLGGLGVEIGECPSHHRLYGLQI